MKKFLSVVRDIAFVIFVLLICGMIFIMSTNKHFSINGYQVLRVITSSMEPAIAENTCIIIRECDTDSLKVGDIITFTSDDPMIQGYYNTHRIHDIVEENGQTTYVTKGDATSAVDAYPVRPEQVVGKYVKELPGGRLIGKCFLALSDNRVYFLVVMLPLMLCLISYFWQILALIFGHDDGDEDEEAADEDCSKEESDNYENHADIQLESDENSVNEKEVSGKSDENDNQEMIATIDLSDLSDLSVFGDNQDPFM